MTNPPPPPQRPAPAVGRPSRQVAMPGQQKKKQRRTGLLLFGLVLVAGSGFGAWYVYESLDQRSDYLVAARDIERWERVRASDFAVVEDLQEETMHHPIMAIPAPAQSNLLAAA